MNRRRMTAISLVLMLVAGLIWVFHGFQFDNRASRATLQGAKHPGGKKGPLPLKYPTSAKPAQTDNFGEATPELLESLITAEAEIIRGDGTRVQMRAVDGEFDLLRIEPNEHLHIQVTLRNVDANQAVLMEADNGGSLNRRVGSLVATPSPEHGSVGFDFSVGGNMGRYALLISQGLRQERLEFRAGPEPPLAAPGPRRLFRPQTS